jgi:hypothetical protein
MPQHLGVAPAQSVSAWQVASPAEGAWQKLGAPGATDGLVHTCPALVLHMESVVQRRGHWVAGLHALPPGP